LARVDPPPRDAPLDLLATGRLQLVRLRVAVVVGVLAHGDDDVRRCARDPGLEAGGDDVVLLVRELGNPRPHGLVGDDHEAVALAEAAARRAPGAVDDPLEHVARDRLVRVVPHHPPAAHDLREVHDLRMIALRTLTDGGQQPVDVAHMLANFLGQAKQSLDIAVYDLKLEGETETIVTGAIESAGQRGVAVRLAYNADFRAPIPVPPPPETAPEDVERLSVPTKPIAGIPDLMHHKYVVRDRAAVWTGSTNWTDDSWSREENVIAVLESPELAHAFTLDFE